MAAKLIWTRQLNKNYEEEPSFYDLGVSLALSALFAGCADEGNVPAT
jgi:hypothetical protein